MNDKQKAARALGYLEGMSALLWSIADEKVDSEMIMTYDEAVETLRKAIDWNDAKGENQ